MNSVSKARTDAEHADASDPVRTEKVKDLLHSLANAVSAMKIFPSDHQTVLNFVDQLDRRFADFLASYPKLQIGIDEYAFTYEGQPVYMDEVAIKSLPFTFFKDGLQILFFYQGLGRQEILAFLELIKAEAQRPPEDSDIVVALWERDFSNIQYYAPDEFLENRILAECRDARLSRDLTDLPEDRARETIEVRVDTSKLTEGRIELNREDREEVERAAARPDDETGPGVTPASESSGTAAAERGQVSPAAAMDPTLTERELQDLEMMVRVNRTISPEDEYVSLMVEILYLEDNPASCQSALDALLEYHFEQVRLGHFHVAVLVIQKIHELGLHLAEGSAKAALLDDFLRRTISPKTIEAVKGLLESRTAMDWEALLAFFALLGPPALGLAADLFAIAPDGEARHRTLAFIEKSGASEPGLLARLAGSARPDLAREIVGILARIPDGRGLPHLASFLNFANSDVKAETVQALGRSRDKTAGRILAGFLNDPDEEIRIRAIMSLDQAQGAARGPQIMREAAGRDFQAKSHKEKEALFALLGRTRSAEALAFLRARLQYAPLFASRKALEVRLAAVTGLEAMGTPEAVAVLRKGVGARKRPVREACAAALVRLAAQGAPEPRGPQ